MSHRGLYQPWPLPWSLAGRQKPEFEGYIIKFRIIDYNMTIKIRVGQVDLSLNYEVYGQGKRLLLLHGWGSSLQSFISIVNPLSAAFQVLLVDLPGFGQSPLPARALGINEYAQAVESFIETLGIEEIFVLGHSFGGAVAISLAAHSRRVKKIILEDSSGIRIKPISLKLKILLFKFIKKITPLSAQENLRRLFGSSDYQQAGPLKDTLVKVVNEDLRPNLSKVTAPTLIIWGENDKETPIKHARALKEGILNSEITVIKNSGHFPHLDNPTIFVETVIKFLDL